MTLFSARRDGLLLGIGALKHIDEEHAELKSMHTSAAARGQGIGRAMVEQGKSLLPVGVREVEGTFGRGVFVGLGDVTGDGLADLIAVNATTVTARRSDRWYFAESEVLQNGAYSSSLDWTLADVTGGADTRVDLIARSSSTNVTVRPAQFRNIKLRVEQFVAVKEYAIPIELIQNAINTANRVFSPAWIQFTLPPENNCS